MTPHFILLFLKSPAVQSVLFLTFLAVALLLSGRKKRESLYNVSAVVYGLFIIVNVILFFFSDKKGWYILEALFVSVLFILAAYYFVRITARIIRVRDDNDEGSMVFLLIIYHPVLLLVSWIGIVLYQWVS